MARRCPNHGRRCRINLLHNETNVGFKPSVLVEAGTWLSLAGVALLTVNVSRAVLRQQGFAAMPAFVIEILLNGVLYLYYYRNVFRNQRVPASRRNLWSIITFLAGPIGQLTYLYRYVKPRSHLQ